MGHPTVHLPVFAPPSLAGTCPQHPLRHMSRHHRSHSLASIHHLAVELLEQIFTYACTDGGYTGRSLSLVSKYFHQVVRPIRFNSVALSSCLGAESFLACLEKERSYIPIRVQHLFLSTRADGDEVVRVRHGHTPSPHWHRLSSHHPSTIHPHHPQWSLWMSLQQVIDKKLARLIPRLFRAVAIDLRTLSIVHSWEFGGIHLPPSFPCLRDLTFCGPPPAFSSLKSDDRRAPPCFPSLRHLHVICGNLVIAPWVKNAPFMTRLRLSDVSSETRSLPGELQAILTGTISGGSSTLSPAMRSSLKHVRLQPRRVSQEWCGTAEVEHSMFVWRLKKVHTRPDARFELMQERRYRDGYWDARIRQDWLDGISDGNRRVGWWLSDEDLEDEDQDMSAHVEVTRPVNRRVSYRI